MNVALLVDGTRLSRGLRAGDVMTVPAGGAVRLRRAVGGWGGASEL